MYLHIIPQLFHLMANGSHLESIVIPELDFKIEGDALSTGKPYPNKNIWVGMRKGRKAINGLLLKTDKHLKWFTVDYQWHIENMGVINHRVTTYIEDNDFDMISHDIMLNGGFDRGIKLMMCGWNTTGGIFFCLERKACYCIQSSQNA